MRKSTILATLLLLAGSLLTACGGGSSVTGEWKLDTDAFKESMEQVFLEQMPAEAASTPEAAAQLKMMLAQFDSMEMTITLADDHTATMKGRGMDADADETGEWSMDGERVKIILDGDPAFATIDGNTLRLTAPEEVDMPAMVFKRQ
jgi:hypothetical protein